MATCKPEAIKLSDPFFSHGNRCITMQNPKIGSPRYYQVPGDPWELLR
jgi:hypothetical protein